MTAEEVLSQAQLVILITLFFSIGGGISLLRSSIKRSREKWPFPAGATNVNGGPAVASREWLSSEDGKFKLINIIPMEVTILSVDGAGVDLIPYVSLLPGDAPYVGESTSTGIGAGYLKLLCNNDPTAWGISTTRVELILHLPEETPGVVYLAEKELALLAGFVGRSDVFYPLRSQVTTGGILECQEIAQFSGAKLM